MEVFVAEVGGRGLAAFSAENADAAREFVDPAGPFCSDLICFSDAEGAPLLSDASQLSFRSPHPDEREKFEASVESARRDGELDDGDDQWVVFLVDAYEELEEDEG